MLYDTLSVEMTLDNISLPNEDDFNFSENHVKVVISRAMKTTDQDFEFPIKFKNFEIKQISDKKYWTKVAYIESPEGYFFVTKPLTEQYQVIYSRWD